ncbi:MAG: phage terminase large subunit [Acetobacteraceae bacterium]|nr:phage terminase large subunit [Acetobacteraceae bacterium]
MGYCRIIRRRFSVGLKICRYSDNQLVVTDVVRLRGLPDQVERAIVTTAATDGVGVTISIPEDPGAAGKSLVLHLTRALMRHIVESSRETGSKETRATPVASQLNAGNISILRAPWNEPFVSELAGFPHGSHDDQVDALSRAFNVLAPDSLAIWEKLAEGGPIQPTHHSGPFRFWWGMPSF